MARRDPVGAQGEREAGVAVQRGVVDRVARHGLARLRVGALGDEVGELGVDRPRLPSQPQRQVGDVHPEVAHDADRAAVARLALPGDRLGAIEVAGVQEVVLDVDDLAEVAPRDRLVGELRAGEERHLARAANEDAGRIDGGDDPLGRGEVDAERLLAQEVLARGDGVEVELLVQVVGDREVEDVDGVVLEQVPAVGRLVGDRADAVEPAQRLGARVAHADELGDDRVVLQRAPAPDGRRQLAPHEPRADDAHADALGRRHVPSPWTACLRARTMAAGSGCWMTLRP